MGKSSIPPPFPNPPKPTFPSGIEPPSSGGFGGGGGSLGGSGQGFSNFSGQFLRLMQEAGERLGRAAGEEIAKVTLKIEGGGVAGGGPGENRGQRRTPGMDLAVQQFARAAGVPGASLMGMAGPVAAGVLLAKLINLPNDAMQQAESQRHFSRISPTMASAFAQSDAKDLMRDLRMGESIAPSTDKLLKARGDFKDTVSGPIGVAWDNWWNRAYTNFLNDLTKMAGPTVKKYIGDPIEGTGINPWVARMDRLAGRQDVEQKQEKAAQKAIDRAANLPFRRMEPAGNSFDGEGLFGALFDFFTGKVSMVP